MLKVVRVLYYYTIKGIFIKMMLAMLESETRSQYSDISIIGLKSNKFDEFSSCVRDALDLLKKERNIEYQFIKANLMHIVYKPGMNKSLATYSHSCCFIQWDKWSKYNRSIRIQIMASIITHEAYHGECFRRFGCGTLGDVKCERMCRKREIRLLQYFKEQSRGMSTTVYDERISFLREKGSEYQSKRK